MKLDICGKGVLKRNRATKSSNVMGTYISAPCNTNTAPECKICSWICPVTGGTAGSSRI